jgi:WD40 repeat protein
MYNPERFRVINELVATLKKTYAMTRRIKILTFLNFLIVVLCNQTTAQNTSTKEILWTTDWSPNGKYIAIGGNVDSLKIYSESNLKTYKSLPIKNTITRVKWHPTKNIIAITTQMSDEKSFIFNLETNEKIELIGISTDGARGIDWNYTGDYLAIADNDGQILIYDIKGKLIRKFVNENTKSITAVDWHPKKNILTTVTDKIRFFDIEGNLLKSIKHRQEEVMLLSIAWHKSGDFFVTGDYGDEKDKSLLQYWDEQGELIKSIDISKGEYRNLAWNPKGDRLASASDALRIWDNKGNLISEGKSIDYLWGVSWNKKGSRIITSSLEQRIILWNKKAKRIMTIE